jgi:hypothetical protein
VTRLAEAGLVGLAWTEDEDDGMIMAEGLQSYEIDTANELAVFQGTKCLEVVKCADFYHAVAQVNAREAVCRWHIQMGCDWRGNDVNERGWVV